MDIDIAIRNLATAGTPAVMLASATQLPHWLRARYPGYLRRYHGERLAALEPLPSDTLGGLRRTAQVQVVPVRVLVEESALLLIEQAHGQCLARPEAGAARREPLVGVVWREHLVDSIEMAHFVLGADACVCAIAARELGDRLEICVIAQ